MINQWVYDNDGIGTVCRGEPDAAAICFFLEKCYGSAWARVESPQLQNQALRMLDLMEQRGKGVSIGDCEWWGEPPFWSPAVVSLDLSQWHRKADLSTLAGWHTEYKALVNSTSLKKLKLGHQTPQPEFIDVFAHNTSITELDLACSFLSSKHLEHIAATNKTLRSLKVGNSYVGDLGAAALLNVTSLTALSISETDITDKGLKDLLTHPSLRKLNACDCHVKSAGVLDVMNNTTLHTLRLSMNKIGLEGVRALAQNTTIKLLRLDYNVLGDPEAVALACSTTIETLGVKGNYITDLGHAELLKNVTLKRLLMGIEHVGPAITNALQHNTTLRSLHCCCTLDPEPAMEMSLNNNITRLTDLWCDEPGIVARLVHWESLTTLWFASVFVDEEAATALVNNTTLVSVCATSLKATRKAAQILKECQFALEIQDIRADPDVSNVLFSAIGLKRHQRAALLGKFMMFWAIFAQLKLNMHNKRSFPS